MGHKICRKCGEINSSSAMYCVNCNSSLKDSKETQDANDESIKFARQSVVYNDSEEVPISKWIMILILLAIPIVNIVAVLLLAFVPDNRSINNFGKASLILGIIGIIIVVLFRGCSGY
jgi:uncharacterized membrane protein YvbJ